MIVDEAEVDALSRDCNRASMMCRELARDCSDVLMLVSGGCCSVELPGKGGLARREVFFFAGGAFA